MIIEKFNELDKLVPYLNKKEKDLIYEALQFSNKAQM